MKKRNVVLISAVSAAAILAGMGGVRTLVCNNNKYVYAMQAEQNPAAATILKETTAKDTAKKIMDDINSVQKEETVYVLGNADGTINKTIVSNWVKNFTDSDTLTDKSDLSDIVNVKGEEAFTSDADGKLTWSAAGNDIYYQGTSEKELPVSVSIKYTLDGTEISPEELAGKSGNLKITVSYTNNQKTTATIDGKKEEVYVPFLCATGMLLDNDTYKNVTVDNGQLINDGAKSAVFGIAFPGLNDSLGVDSDKVDFPSEFSITADVTDYDPLVMMTVVTNDVFNHIDLKDTGDLSGLSDSLTELSDASIQLTDGCVDLYDGIKTLSEKSSALIDGVTKLSNGASTLSTSLPALTKGAGELKAGVDSVKAGADSLKSGADQVDAGMDSLNAAAGQVKGGITKVDTGLSQLTAQNTALNAGAEQIFNSILATANAQIKAASLEVPELTKDNYAAVLDQTVAALSKAGTDKAEIKQAIVTLETLKEQLDSVNTFCTGVKAYTDGVSQAQAGTKQLAAGAAQLAAGTEKLSDATQQLSDGAGALSTGATKLSAGAKSLSDGSKKAEDGAKQLADGLNSLLENSKLLVDGISQLEDGSKTLKEGMQEFNDTGIQKLVDAFDGDINKLLDRVDALADVSKEYQSFSGIEDGMKGSVKFIIKNE